MFVSVAHAMGSPAGGGGNSPEAMLTSFAPLLLMLAIFYFLLIRPQQKRAKEHKAMLQALKKGDTIITSAGFIGRIVEIDDDLLTVDLGETKVQIARGYVAGLSGAKVKQAPRKDERKADKKAERKEEKDEQAESAKRDADADEE